MARNANFDTSGIIARKLENYCAYQERCIKDVTSKLKDWNLKGNQIEKIIEDLKKNNFLDESRFAKAYARGKFRINKWGKQRIAFELHLKNIDVQLIQEGLNEIPGDEYLGTLREIILKKARELTGEITVRKPARIKPHLNRNNDDTPVPEIISSKNLNVREKIINFANTKGYEMSLILDILNELKI
jgi:regulatory protein